ncbi:hypothetical protein [Fimbriimonas ginsengisoli]|uniref:hypothetical protein n=1 Tax=Fimbriimonas ginsengisoli TaxID=1005039 RepID=UPI00046CF9F6|nr:hypothetical protein [Fimbriimonas ginsengisoli]
MIIKTTLALALASIVSVGCGSHDGGDTSPPPAQDTKARVDGATKRVDSSDMTPEQKKAATDYLRQGAANAEQIKKSAQGAPGGAPK